jgi:hypothetical protein
MSQTEVERCIGRIVTDGEFREKAARSLGTACYDEGFVLSPRELALLERLDFHCFAAVAELLDDALRRR